MVGCLHPLHFVCFGSQAKNARRSTPAFVANSPIVLKWYVAVWRIHGPDCSLSEWTKPSPVKRTLEDGDHMGRWTRRKVTSEDPGLCSCLPGKSFLSVPSFLLPPVVWQSPSNHIPTRGQIRDSTWGPFMCGDRSPKTGPTGRGEISVTADRRLEFPKMATSSTSHATWEMHAEESQSCVFPQLVKWRRSLLLARDLTLPSC